MIKYIQIDGDGNSLCVYIYIIQLIQSLILFVCLCTCRAYQISKGKEAGLSSQICHRVVNRLQWSAVLHIHHYILSIHNNILIILYVLKLHYILRIMYTIYGIIMFYIYMLYIISYYMIHVYIILMWAILIKSHVLCFF